jgi:hypothetical protein
MTNANPLIAGVAPALLAVAATVVSLLLLQFALLVAWIAMLAVIARLRDLAPYAAIELVLPGGSVIALLLWLYRRQKRVSVVSRWFR